MILVSHPTGNAFVRALLDSLQWRKQDFQFHTTLGFSSRSAWFQQLPERMQRLLGRRAYDVPAASCHPRPCRDAARLALQRVLGPHWVARHCPALSARAIYRQLDLAVADWLRREDSAIETLHAYEDGARHSFRAGAELGLRRVYHLPIAYWPKSRQILEEEAQRWPEWAPTLGLDRSNGELDEHKAEELRLASEVICPSEFVLRTLPESINKRCVVAMFGSPPPELEPASLDGDRRRPLRVLFAGSFTQRKGLADLFAAFRQLQRRDVELILAGTPILPLDFYRRRCPNFHFEPSRSHRELLQLMGRCDLLVLPSLVEGRALVQQEALSRGLPILITPHTGGEDLIEPGTGFLVPIRQPERIAERIDWLADHREELPEMRRLARAKAARYSWQDYAAAILGPSEWAAPTALASPA